MKLKHFCLLFGFALIALAFTVFANAETLTFDCSNTFNCSIKEGCENVSGAVAGLLVHHGTAYSTEFYGPLPIDYYFYSSTTGKALCSATVTVSGQVGNQTNEVTSVYLNNTLLGTTKDNYCNSCDTCGCAFCGKDTQFFSAKEVTLTQPNTLRVYGYDSHAVVSVVLNCEAVVDCTNALAPIIETIPNKSTPYNLGFEIDLWDYVNDYDNPITDVNLSVSVEGNSVLCSVRDNRYLNCDTNDLGYSTVKIKANDVCKTTSSQFTVNVTNNSPIISVPDYSVSCKQDLNKFIDLSKYSLDEAVSALTYEIVSQSNPSLIDCNIVDSKYVSCKVKSCDENYSNITIRATDELGLVKEDSFKITVTNSAPVWKTIPSQCINSSKSKFINLKDYALDAEDGNNLSFTLDQNSVSGFSCLIESGSFVSCTLSTTKNLSLNLLFKATDSKGKYSTTTMNLSANCFDENGNDSNSTVLKFESSVEGLCMERCTTYSVPLVLENKSNSKKCFNFDAEVYPSNKLRVSLSSSSTCLNAKQSTKIYVSLNSCNADERQYTVRVFDYDSNLSLSFGAEVGSCNNSAGFRIEEFDGKICAGEKKQLSVFVRNTSSASKRVYLKAENEMFLPYFSKEIIDLAGGEEKEVALNINTLNAKEGTYFVSISGDADNFHIEKRVSFDIVDCSSFAERTFRLSVPDVCFDVKKGGTLESQFTITRQGEENAFCDNTKKPFYLSVNGMPSVVSFSTVNLLPNEGKAITFTVNVPKDAPAGYNFLTIMGSDGSEWNSFTEQKPLCVNVLGENKAGLTVNTQSKNILWCGSEIFEVLVSNTGDFDANYELQTIETPAGVSVSFSHQKFSLKKGESKNIFVSVSTSPNAQVKDNQQLKIKLKGPVELTAVIYFNVKEKTSFEDIEILSYTQKVEMYSNDTASYNILIRNNSGSDLNSVLVSFENVPVGVEIESVYSGAIKAGKTVSVLGTIKTNSDVNGIFEPVFVVTAGSMANKEKFSLVVTKREGFFAGLFTGLFSFSAVNIDSSELIYFLFVAIVLIVFVSLIIFTLSAFSKGEKREAWMEQ